MDGRAPPRPRIEVCVLGPIRAVADGRDLELGGARQQALLAALAQDLGRTVSVDALVDAVWDGAPPAAAVRTFRTYVARLRKSLSVVDGIHGTDVVRTDDLGYRLDEDLVALDSRQFLALLDEARERLAVGEATVALRLLDEGLDLWSGAAYAQFADQPWARAEARRLEEQRVVARELRVQALLDSGRADEAVVDADVLDTDHPFREPVARLRVLARYRLGRHAEALAVLRSFRGELAEATGLDPSPRLAELEQLVLQQDPRLDRPAAGRRLRGYVLGEVVATTALGTVHRAEQPSIGREVAITVVAAEQADDPDVVRSFEARAQQIAAVEHPHVVPLYDYWREPGGAYLVTRFHAAGSLAQRLRDGPVDAAQAQRVVEQVGRALAAAHERGVVHGAVAPDAVLLDERGDAFLGGFRLLDEGIGFAADLAGLVDLAADLLAGAHVGTGQLGGTDRLTRVLDAARDPRDETVTTVAGLVRRLHEALAGDEEDDAAPAPSITGPNPYRGLAAFQETDAAVFFGREDLTAEVLGRLARQPFLALSGPSGSGKSSVVRAGVLPRLRGEGAFVTTMVPGTAPLAELVVALSRIAAVELPPDAADRAAHGDAGLTGVLRDVLPAPDGEAVLVIDQFEELFTLTPAAERAAFLAAIAAALDHPGRRLRVIATVRADFLGRALEDPVAGGLLHQRTVLARPLTDDELHEAVTRPAEVAGLAVEPALATAVVADATRFPGSLPMVQFALTEVFEAAEDGTMTLAAYRRIGGIEGVLGQRAEEVFQDLDEAGRRGARALFQRLVVPHDDGPPTRRRAWRTEFDHVPPAVIDAFGQARLLRFDHDDESREPTVEVTHEALFRAWPRLVAWIEEGEDDLRLLGHLTVSADEWEAGGRREADLYRGHRLDAALGFARDRRSELSPSERAFLDAATGRRARDVEADRRSVRRLRVLTGGLAVGLVLALVAGAMAVVAQREEAAARQDLGELADDLQTALDAEATTSATARARELAGLSTLALEDDPERSVLLALEAVRVARDGGTAALPEARSALQVATSRHRVRVRVPDAGLRTSVSPDGARIATSGGALDVLGETPVGPGGEPTHVALWSPAGDRLGTVVADGPVVDVAWVDDGLLAVLLAIADGTATAAAVYDVATGDLVTELASPPEPVLHHGLHADEGLVVATSGLQSVAWDARRGELLHATDPGQRLSIVDGARLAVWDGTGVWTLDLQRGVESPRFATPPATDMGPVRGDLLPLLDFQGSAMSVVDLGTGEVVADTEVPTPTAAVGWVDDRRVAAADNTGDLRVLDTATGQGDRWRPVTAGGTWDVSASRDGDVLAVTTSGGIGDLAVVETTAGDAAFELGRPPVDLHGVSTRDVLLADFRDGVVALDTERGTTDVLLDGITLPPGAGQRTTSSADGSTVGWIDADLRGWVQRDGQRHELPRCHNPRGFSDDGRLALVDTVLPDGCPPGEDATAVPSPGYVLDVVTGDRTVLPTDAEPDAAVLDGAFGPPDTPAAGLAVVNRGFFRAEVVDVGSAEVLASFTPPVGVLYGAAVSPDGSTALWGSDTGRLTVLDIAALRSARAFDPTAHVRHLEAGGQTGLSITADGDHVAAGTGNEQVIVFDRTTGERIARFDVDAARRPVVELHRDSLYYSDGSAVRRMPLDIDEAVAIAESRLTRGWTPEECEEYGIADC